MKGFIRIDFTNDFHNTESFSIAKVENSMTGMVSLTRSQVARLKKHLCTRRECKCSGIFGDNSKNAISYEEKGDKIVFQAKTLDRMKMAENIYELVMVMNSSNMAGVSKSAIPHYGGKKPSVKDLVYSWDKTHYIISDGENFVVKKRT